MSIDFIDYLFSFLWSMDGYELDNCELRLRRHRRGTLDIMACEKKMVLSNTYIRTKLVAR